MKRSIIFTVTCMTLLFCSCERLYTADELGVLVEWSYSGWSEVFNETAGTVTMITSHYPYLFESNDQIAEIPSDIQPGEAVFRRIGCNLPGESIQESLSVTIRLNDGTEIVCTRGSTDSWSNRFYRDNVQMRQGYEVVEMQGKKVRHDINIKTYHIDNTLIDLWRSGQQ